MNNMYTASPEFTKDPGSCLCAGPVLYPLLESMLRSKGLKLQATYTCRDVADLFGVTPRTIQYKVKDGTLPSRKLIGGGRFLPIDLENYLQNAGYQPTETVRQDTKIFTR